MATGESALSNREPVMQGLMVVDSVWKHLNSDYTELHMDVMKSWPLCAAGRCTISFICISFALTWQSVRFPMVQLSLVASNSVGVCPVIEIVMVPKGNSSFILSVCYILFDHSYKAV